jgi:hypothetical protein
MPVLPVLALVAASLMPVAVLADPPDIAYDQAQRIYVIDTSAAPPLGSFDDFRNTFETLAPSITYPPLPGVLPAAPGAGGVIAAAARQKDGVVYHYSFLGTSVRVDDVAAQKATIGRPDKGEVEYLDLKAKTYTTVGGDAAKALLEPSVAALVKAAIPAPPPASPTATVAFKVGATQTPIGDRTFGDIATKGIDYTLSMKSESTSEACGNVTVSADSVAYFDPSREERVKYSDADNDPEQMLRAMQSGRGCIASFDGTIPPRDPLFKRFFLYSRNRISFTIASLPTPIDVLTIVERGNVKPLTAADASLFEIPAGFKAAGEAAPSATK